MTGPVDMAGVSGGVSRVCNSSRLRKSRTIAISIFRETARQGSASLASATLVTAGRSTGGEQVMGRIVRQGVRANLHLFPPLRDDDHARLVGDMARGRWRRSAV